MEIIALPLVHVLSRVPLFQFRQHILSAIAAARSANLPKVRCHHVLEIGCRSPVFRAVKNWLPADEFTEDIKQCRVSCKRGLHPRIHGIIIDGCPLLADTRAC
jgi:hypothetical protein